MSGSTIVGFVDIESEGIVVVVEVLVKLTSVVEVRSFVAEVLFVVVRASPEVLTMVDDVVVLPIVVVVVSIVLVVEEFAPVSVLVVLVISVVKRGVVPLTK